MNPNDRTLAGPRRASLWMYAAAIALTACGGGGGADRTAPSVTIAALAATVSRTVTLEATASDDKGVTQVEFRVDGTAIGTDASPPFSQSWNTGAVTDGSHSITAVARDAAGNTTTSAAATVTVSNARQYAVSLTGREEIPASGSAGTGSGTLGVNLASGAISGAVTVGGFTATAAHIHDGYAGVSGGVVVGLEQDSADPARWVVPANATLTSAQVDRLLAGGLYVNAHSVARPAGEVRGQVLPPDFAIYFAELSGVAEIPEVSSESGGRAAVTLNTATRVASIHLTTLGPDGVATGLAGANAAHLHRAVAGLAGPVIVGLAQDANAASHWFVDQTTLVQSDVDALRAAQTYVNVHTGDRPDGAIRGQVVPPGYAVIVSRMNGEQEAPTPRITAARGTAAVTVNTASGAADVVVNVSGADDANAAHVHDGFAGVAGPVLIGLEKDASVPTRWRSNGATMTPAQIEALQNGQYYANVHTPAAPAGLVRGQLLPAGVELVISHLTGAQEAPSPLATAATGRASTTVNLGQRLVTVHVNTSGLDDGIAAHVHRAARGVAGGIEFGLTADPASPAHWSASQVAVTDAQLADYRAGLWYVNVHTPDNPGGEARAQIELGGVAPLQFEDLQARIFNTTCATSGCHSGAGAPFGLDLGTGVSHDNLVGQASGEVPSLLRVAPGDAPDSYLIRKLDGGPGIVGVRMPNGLPLLPDATIARIRAWVNAGALPAPAPPADTVAPAVTLGSVAATVSGMVTLSATASDNVGVTLVRFRVNGSVVGSDATEPYSFDWNTTGVANGAVTIDAQALDAAGNVGASATASTTVSNSTGPTPYTFTEIQTQIFTPTCAVSGCHTGGSPAAGQNLSAGSAYAQIVGVASSEMPGLQRINPGNAAQSYLIQKLEGAPGITGQRMPFGGPFLPQETIDRIRAWVDAGAPNN